MNFNLSICQIFITGVDPEGLMLDYFNLTKSMAHRMVDRITLWYQNLRWEMLFSGILFPSETYGNLPDGIGRIRYGKVLYHSNTTDTRPPLTLFHDQDRWESTLLLE